MPAIEELKSAAQAEIDRYGTELIRVAQTILEHPEPGFREWKTSGFAAQKFRDLGIPFQEGIALTGLKAMLDTGHDGPTVGVIGELDSLKVLGHPHADPETSAAHACGHHCQIAMMLGVGIGLQAVGVLSNLAGRIALMATPAEEYIEIEYRDALRRQGELEFLGGKNWQHWNHIPRLPL
jgi:metal-dependent amidase/aminoacylase/carboxypeptidase family protein